MNTQEIIVTCPCCDSSNIVAGLHGYLSCSECNWNEYEETFPSEYNWDYVDDRTCFDDRCEHGIWIEDDCDDCNEKLAFDMGVQ